MIENTTFEAQSLRIDLSRVFRETPEDLQGRIHEALSKYPDHRTSILTIVDEVSNQVDLPKTDLDNREVL